MKKGFLLFLAIALTIIGLYIGWTNHNRESGGKAKPPPGLDLITDQGIGAPAAGSAQKPSEPVVTDQDRVQLSTLNSILASKNDNDQRLDKDLRVLSPGAKALLRQRYEEFPAERRNERGTVVFLLGRNITEEKDLDFMRKVLDEEPCRSMQNCREDNPRAKGSDTHAEMGMEVSLNYPQIVAVKSLERVLDRGEGDPMYQAALEELQRATHSASDKVSEMAREIEAKYGKSRSR